jgi:hypothetical protein
VAQAAIFALILDKSRLNSQLIGTALIQHIESGADSELQQQ